VIDQEKREFGGWWVWVLGLLIISTIVLTILGYVGVIGRTIVERKVFENSYQYSEARKTEIMTYEAQLAEIDAQLSTAGETERHGLLAQRAAIEVRLRVARERSE